MKSNRLSLSYAGIFLGAFLLYLATCAPGVLWQDSGMFQMRTFQGDYQGDLGLALSHPLYMLFTRAAAMLPFGEYAWRVNLVSAVFGAITIANVFLLTRLLTGSFLAGLLSALTLGVGHTFWAHCTIAEVYTLTTAALSAELLCLAMYFWTKKPYWLWGLFLANGLGVANHNLSALAIPVYAGLLVFEIVKCRISAKHLWFCGLFWIAGALPLEILAWGYFQAGHGIRETIYSVLFGNFESAVLSVQLPGLKALLYPILQFPTPNLVIAIFGIAYPFQLVKVPGSQANSAFGRIVLILLGIFLLFAIRYRVPDQYVFFLPAYLLTAVLIGAGSQYATKVRGAQMILILLSLFPIVIYWAAPGWLDQMHKTLPGVTRTVPYRQELRYFLQPWKQNERSAEEFAQAVKENIPPGSVIITDSTTVRPLEYFQQVRGELLQHFIFIRSEDVLADGTVVLGQNVSKLPTPAKQITSSNLDELRKQRGVYVVTPQKGYCSPWLLDHYEFTPEWPLYKITEGRKESFHPSE